MGENRATNAATTQYPAADQKAQDPPMIFVFAFVFALVVDVIVVLVFLLPMLAHEMGKKQAADAGATQEAARNQELQNTMLLIASLLAFLTHFLAFFLATPFTQQAREKQAPHTPTPQAAANCQFLKFQITHDTFSILLRLKPSKGRGPISAPSGVRSRTPRGW
jgi:hypothetical protein